MSGFRKAPTDCGEVTVRVLSVRRDNDAPLKQERGMSTLAKDLVELVRLAQGGAGALIEHLLREVASNLIAQGVADERGGC